MFKKAALGLLLLAGCAPKIPVRDPQVSLPSAYAAPTSVGDSLAQTRWSAVYTDPGLAELITVALDNNQELRILEQEIFIARSEFRGRQGEIFPSVGVGLGVGTEKVGRFTSQGASDADDPIVDGELVPEVLNNVDVGFVASWEVDVWRKLRNSRDAAQQRYLATVEGRNFAVTQLVAEIANTWYELLALDSELAALQSNVDLQQEAITAVRLQLQAARVTALAVQRFEAALLDSQSRQYRLRQQITETENHLNLLCGRPPQPIARDASDFTALAPVVPRAGVPPQLLEDRPDVRAAERELAAAHLDVQVARAMFYPALSIDAELGVEAFEAAYLATLPESLLFGVSGRLLGPLLNRRALKANHSAATARQRQAVLDYERAVITAYAEVETELARTENLSRAVDLRAQQATLLQQAVETSGGLFQSARADYLEVLTTRQEALESQIALIEAKQQQLSASVNVYQALGGGWRQPESE